MTITENEAAFARLLLVDRLPAGLEIDNPDLFEGGSTEALSSLVVGRKGSGKTALFIQLRNRIRSDRDRRNIVVDLRPEGYQLIKIKEDILTYLNEGARQHLITAFYEYIILLDAAYTTLATDRNTYLFLDLEQTYKIENFSTEGDFSERLLTLSQRLSEEYKSRCGRQAAQRLTTNDVTDLLYTHDIRQLREKFSKYLEHKGSVLDTFL